MKKEKLYKILVDGKSCHGGDLKWSLPKGKKAGDWHEVTSDIKICETGIHLTSEPFKWYKWGCTCYEAEAKDIGKWQDDKCVVRAARLLKEVKHPKWWIDTCGWVDTLKNIAWLKPDGKPNKEWKLFETRAAAGDAALYGRALVSEWNFESKYRTHIKARMEVWQKGYGLLCDVNGVLYCYKKIS